MLKKTLSISLIVALLVPYSTVLAQQETETKEEDPCLQAAIDAKRDINAPLWFGAGCLFGVFGVGASYVVEPSPSAVRLMGKSPEYAAMYTDCYKMDGKKIQQQRSLYGCLTWAALYLLLIASVPAE